MAKKLQVLLNKNVDKLGKRGEVVEVAPGYARNYLIPQGLGLRVTPGVLKQVEQRKEKELQRIQALKADAESRKTALKTIGRLTIRKQVGEKDSIFGTVTTQEVAEVIQAMANLEVDKRTITLPEINKTGIYQAEIKLHPEVTAIVELQVAPQ